MQDLPSPKAEPTSPTLADRFLTTEPPGKPCHNFLKHSMYSTWKREKLCQGPINWLTARQYQNSGTNHPKYYEYGYVCDVNVCVCPYGFEYSWKRSLKAVKPRHSWVKIHQLSKYYEAHGKDSPKLTQEIMLKSNYQVKAHGSFKVYANIWERERLVDTHKMML